MTCVLPSTAQNEPTCSGETGFKTVFDVSTASHVIALSHQAPSYLGMMMSDILDKFNICKRTALCESELNFVAEHTSVACGPHRPAGTESVAATRKVPRFQKFFSACI
jgi:hypothetical protein